MSVGILKEVDCLADLSTELLRGHTALFLDNSPEVIILGTRKEITRSAQEPPAEILVRAPGLALTRAFAIIQRYCGNVVKIRT